MFPPTHPSPLYSTMPFEIFILTAPCLTLYAKNRSNMTAIKIFGEKFLQNIFHFPRPQHTHMIWKLLISIRGENLGKTRNVKYRNGKKGGSIFYNFSSNRVPLQKSNFPSNREGGVNKHGNICL